MFDLTKQELKIFKKLTTPIKIQDFLDSVPVNWEKKGETYMSPRRALQAQKMHCFEGALFAAVALWLNGEEPLVMDFKNKGDDDHVVALYRRNGYWGAISKTNHASVRFRDPVYKTIRELALSYFHEYFRERDGKKTLVSFSSKPFDLRVFGTGWITTPEDLDAIAEAVDVAPHTMIYPKKNARFIRTADAMEQKAGRLIEWKKSDPRT
ncbi:MAG: hypothetical protein KBC69_04855 [Candidatus Magasanikbacteria bacterium]|nr:hypothetical protein [Candidatus Magasanikbacteria bacterium]